MMELSQEVLDIAERHSLKERAMNAIDKVLDACIEADKEIGIDFLEGNERSDLIYQFGRYELQVDSSGFSKIVTRINIYSKKLFEPNIDRPVGYYSEHSSTSGEQLDEFLMLDWTPISFNIAYHAERIGQTIPQRYLKRNVAQYEFATYVNHIVSLVIGRQFEAVAVFIKRALDFLEKNDRIEFEDNYMRECQELFKSLFYFIKNNGLIESEQLESRRIEERLKTKS